MDLSKIRKDSIVWTVKQFILYDILKPKVIYSQE